MTKIYVVRHGESEWNAQKLWAGQANPSLTEEGRRQAIKFCEQQREHPFSSVTSSELKRANETALIISNNLKCELLEPIADLNERNYGKISGMSSSEIESAYPEFLREWRKGKPTDIPGGEPWAEFSDRVLNGLKRLTYLPDFSLVVAHMGILRVIEHSQGKIQSRHENLAGIWLDIE